MGRFLEACCVLIVYQVLSVEVHLAADGSMRREHVAQKVRFQQGRVSDLTRDELFNMSWAAETGHRQTSTAARVEKDDCASFHGPNHICHIESPEHALVRKWMPANATVMEFGARFGTTTCEIAKQLQNSGRLVSIEPDQNAWSWLEDNIKSHNCQAHVLRGAVSGSELKMLGSGYGGRSETAGSMTWLGSKLGMWKTWTVPTFTFDDVEKASGLKFDTLLIDCEGCAQDLMDQVGPKIQTQINLVLIEADMPDTGGDCTSHCMDYKKFFSFLADSGLEQVDMFNDCDRSRSEAPEGTWCGSWINHYAFRRK